MGAHPAREAGLQPRSPPLNNSDSSGQMSRIHFL
jgi:hypothetical protein